MTPLPPPRLKQLEAALCSIPASRREFVNPSIILEQYPTSTQLTAAVVQLAASERYQDLGLGRSVLDLGCGTGMLTMGAALVGSTCIYAVDCDEDALRQARQNVQELLGEDEEDHDDDEDDDDDQQRRPHIEYILAKVQMNRSNLQSTSGNNKGNNHKPSKGGRGGRGRGGRGSSGGGGGGRGSQPAALTKARIIRNGINGTDGIPLRDNCVDTVITNPPFGTKADNQGIDLQFLCTATRLAKRAVYSFHKRSTRPFLLRTIHEWGHTATVVAEMSFDVKQMYQFHKLKTKDIDVDLIRIEIQNVEDKALQRQQQEEDGKDDDVDDD